MRTRRGAARAHLRGCGPAPLPDRRGGVARHADFEPRWWCPAGALLSPRGALRFAAAPRAGSTAARSTSTSDKRIGDSNHLFAEPGIRASARPRVRPAGARTRASRPRPHGRPSRFSGASPRWPPRSTSVPQRGFSSQPAQAPDVGTIRGLAPRHAAPATSDHRIGLGVIDHESRQRRSRMGEMSTSGSGEGPGEATTRGYSTAARSTATSDNGRLCKLGSSPGEPPGHPDSGLEPGPLRPRPCRGMSCTACRAPRPLAPWRAGSTAPTQ